MTLGEIESQLIDILNKSYADQTERRIPVLAALVEVEKVRALQEIDKSLVDINNNMPSG